MTSEFFKYHLFWNRIKIATYRLPRGAWALNGDSRFQGGGCLAQIVTEFRIIVVRNEHLTSCVRMDVLQYEEGLKSISLFLHAWFKFVRYFLGHTVCKYGFILSGDGNWKLVLWREPRLHSAKEKRLCRWNCSSKFSRIHFRRTALPRRMLEGSILVYT